MPPPLLNDLRTDAPTTRPRPRRRALLGVVVTVLASFAAIAPTLTWLEFSSGSENLNVATAMEMLREGRWLLPTLDGEARVAKPPLTAWITAAAIERASFDGMRSADANVRAAAESQLAWQIRWPFLMASCLMLLATAELGRVLSGGDGRIAVIAAAVCASNLFFLRHGRLATTDVQLALWVAVTNVFLAHAVMRGRWWTGALGAGATLGLAFMSKGPVALVQSVAAVAVFLVWQWWIGQRRADETEAEAHREDDGVPLGAPRTPGKTRIVQFVVGVAVFALVALPWYAIVAARNPDVWARWQMEVTREGATDLPPGKPWAYLSLFAFIAPWTAFLIAGIAVVVRDARSASPGAPAAPSPGTPGESWGEGSAQLTPDAGRSVRARTLTLPSPGVPGEGKIGEHRSSGSGDASNARARGMVLALLLVVVPIVIMSLFRDRKERYLLPMIVPAAVVIARAVVEHFHTRHLGNGADRAVVAIHWITLAVIAVGMPIAGSDAVTAILRVIRPDAGAVGLTTLDGGRWFSPAVAGLCGAACVGIVAGGFILHRRGRSGAIVAATLLLMLVMQALFMHGYRNAREGRSEMKPLATVVWDKAPSARVFITGAKKVRAPSDLPIYLNRSVPWVDDVNEIATQERPAVVVTRQRRREPEPAPPPGWTPLGKTARDNNWWHAFIRPADLPRQ